MVAATSALLGLTTVVYETAQEITGAPPGNAGRALYDQLNKR